jgi:glycosyltransferase involved in cell wall biosynthesis
MCIRVRITVDTPEEMIQVAQRLKKNHREREQLAKKSKAYYKKYLDHDVIIQKLRDAYLCLVK